MTDEPLRAFSLKTGKQRMDSTQLASNIRQMGRVQLLVTVLQRVHRMLSEEEQPRYAELFEPYLKGHAGQHVYHLKTEELPEHLQRIGRDMQHLLHADFPVSVCQACPLRPHCPVGERKRVGKRRLRFTAEERRRARRWRGSRQHRQEGLHLRPAVEATVRSVKHPFPAGKLPVRGRFRATGMVIGAAVVTNVRRLHRYCKRKWRASKPKRGDTRGEKACKSRRGRLFFLLFEPGSRLARFPPSPPPEFRLVKCRLLQKSQVC